MIKSRIKLYSRFLKYFYPYYPHCLSILALTGIVSLVNPIGPYLTKILVDGVIAKKDLSDLFLPLAALAGISVTNGLIQYLIPYLERYIKLRAHFDASKSAFSHIQNFSYRWFQDKTAGEHIYKISNDMENIINSILDFPQRTISLILGLILTTSMIFYLNWKIALILFCLIPLFNLPLYRFSKRIRLVCERLIENAETILNDLGETFSHTLVIKAFGRENSVVKKYLDKLTKKSELDLKRAKLDYYSKFLAEWLNRIAVGLVAIWGLYWVTKDYMTLGTLTAIMFYTKQLMGLQGQFDGYYHEILTGTLSCKRIAEVLDDRPDVMESQDAKDTQFTMGAVVFENVSFGYTEGQYILRNMDFRIEGGSHMALVGPSGCGKSTTVFLMLRLFDPSSGSIFIDGHNIKELKLNTLKSQIGIALQEPMLWNDTIANNIKFAVDDVGRETIEATAKHTGVDEFSQDLPNGLDTVIGENACKISEGQKQKIAIARALIKKPKILILDEAMSSMESASEDKIIRNIKEHCGGTTLITISHRLSTVMKADYVYLLAQADRMIVNKTQDIRENPESLMFFAEQTSAIIHPL